MGSLRESAIRDFLLGQLAPEDLTVEALQAIHRVDLIMCQVDIEDMQEAFESIQTRSLGFAMRFRKGA